MSIWPNIFLHGVFSNAWVTVYIKITLKRRPDICAGIEEISAEEARESIVRVIEILRAHDRNADRRFLSGQAAVVVQDVLRVFLSNAGGKAKII